MKQVMVRGLWVALLILVMQQTWAQQKPAYLFYSGEGKSLKYKKVLKQLGQADVILFGELHNNPIAHWLQLELLQDLYAQLDSGTLVLGAEMFETHQQAALDRFLSGDWDDDTFEEQTELWPNYPTDYRPLVRFARSKGLPFYATNCPREYARQVAYQGPSSLDSLPDSTKALLVPLPYEIDYELPSYAAMRDMMAGHGGSMNTDFFIAAQAIKDATMAYNIYRHMEAGQKFYHLNGSYHSDSKEGIAWYLLQARPTLSIVNLTVVEQADLSDMDDEHKGKADVVIVVPETMTKTYVTGFE